MPIEPLAIGVCSWSLQVTSVPELKQFMDRLGVTVVQIACGDPHHASWSEGDDMPAAARRRVPDERQHARLSRRRLHLAANYPEDRRVRRPRPCRGATRAASSGGWTRTEELGLSDIMLHAGFIPAVGDPGPEKFPRHTRAGGGTGPQGRRHRGFRDRPGDRRHCSAVRWTI